MKLVAKCTCKVLFLAGSVNDIVFAQINSNLSNSRFDNHCSTEILPACDSECTVLLAYCDQLGGGSASFLTSLWKTRRKWGVALIFCNLF